MRISDWSSDVCSSDLLTSVEDDRALVGLGDAGDGLEEGGLPGTVGAEEGEDLALLHVEVDAEEHLHAVVADLHAAGHEQRRLAVAAVVGHGRTRSEEHTSELQSLMRISYAVFCLKKKKKTTTQKPTI